MSPLCRASVLALLLTTFTVAAEPAVYRSTFDSYLRWPAEPTPPAWRTANDEMGRLGGHAGHLKHAAGEQPARQSAQPDHKGHHPGSRP
ncbi:hypothetical protein [Chitinimonas lacunae]|uniref:Uncharacterized protein n=1 Tax=Chitinimonas lacunae TaxID=1963018 RepID=A0ABV8MX38_9NEIS